MRTEPTLIEHRALRYRTGNHQTPDALVYIPPGFNPSRPVNLVIYNHGLSTNVSQAFRNSDLQQQLDQAPANTVLIVPEWQQEPNTRSHQTGSLNSPGFFRGMLGEILQKTPALERHSLDDVASISVIAHSGGFNPTMPLLYKNGLEDKVVSVTLLDALYNDKGFDQWIEHNIHDLASGRKRFQNIYSGTAGQSLAQASRIHKMLAKAGLPQEAMIVDNDRGREVLDSSDIASRGIIFKRSNISVRGRGAHNSVTNIYVGEVMRARNEAMS